MIKFDFLNIDLTPSDDKYDLAGFGKRDLSEVQFGVREVRMRLVWFKTHSSDDLIVVSLDTLYFPTWLADEIYRYFEEAYGIDSRFIICNATHTHSSPNLTIELFGNVDTVFKNHILNTIKDKMPKLGSNFIKSRLIYSSCDLGKDLLIGRRKCVPDYFNFTFKKKALFLPNEHQVIDNGLRVLSVTDESGRVVSTIFNLSCHPVFASNTKISSDFPGVVSKNLERSGAVFSLFLQGFCGDVRPKVVTKGFFKGTLRQRVKSFLYGDVFGVPTTNDLECFSERVADKVQEVAKSGVELTSEFKAKVFELTLVSDTGAYKKLIKIKLVRLDSVILISIPAEVLSPYLLILKEKFPEFEFLPLGFADDMIGYLPSPRQYLEGGYEVTSSINYGWDSPISESSLRALVDSLCENVSDLLREAK
ncbi:hypothetical protein [Vibrio sp. HN007]|uniref:hypothetical protein n=1 Tax=Vibrio iocasae TaxID=3098914 RepID=UPI0035D5221D